MLPKDPNILFSLLNMKLRDFYSSLDALCDDLYEDRQEIEQLMHNAGYIYDPNSNSFVKEI